MRGIVLLLAAVALWSTRVLAQNAADAFYDPAEMAKARTALKMGHGSQINTLILGERLEYHSNDGNALTVWEGQGWVGGDTQKLWFKTEGEYAVEESRVEEAELEVLYSRAVSPFWELQAGLRQDIKPSPSRTYAVIGTQGLAPYWFEFDGALFLSNQGDISARIEAEYEFRLSQRLLLQPRVELNAAFSDDEAISVGSGLSSIQAGLRLRYEVAREFAPYVGIAWVRSFGETKDFQRIDGEDVNQVSIVAGVRFWF